MQLSTLTCGKEGCYQVYSEDIDMWHVIDHARDLGWTVGDNDKAFCPDHDPNDVGIWVVGCHTCDFEEEFDNEEDAKYEYQEHDCDPDTYIRTPEQVEERQAQTIAWRALRIREEERTKAAATAALETQHQIERDAAHWAQLRSIVLFWKGMTWQRFRT